MFVSATSVVPYCVIGIAIVLAAASMHDVATRTVSNRLVLMLAILSGVISVATGHILEGLLSGLMIFSLAVLCWWRGWMGGGDVKLLGAVGLALRTGQILPLLVAVALAGGILACIYLVARACVANRLSLARPRSLFGRVWRIERWRLHRGCPLPYVCAIAAGSLFVLL
ncbi:A24 family peptidase [Gluconacetobacter tumulisoli]|uniref:Peptidase A24 n=1 Tax=Gluconacetobacter tumulisoli TaxID=1286189 RepID=A0A7W4KAG7_9PROT|nr:prepilin peptidase [Gluconacetobacter tumulisoli]MBB2203315.1 peptidase A24 [Gluconacetobacter tumulisoli]